MNTISWLMLLLAVWFFLLLMYMLRKRKNYQNRAKDKKLFFIPRKDGGLDIELLPTIAGKVVRTTRDEEGNEVKREIQVRSDLGYDTYWPPGEKTKFYQVPIKAYFVPEGYPGACNFFAHPPIFTDATLYNIKTEAFSRAMVQRGEEMSQEIEERKKPKRKMGRYLYLIGGIILLVIAMIVMVIWQGPGIKLF